MATNVGENDPRFLQDMLDIPTNEPAWQLDSRGNIIGIVNCPRAVHYQLDENGVIDFNHTVNVPPALGDIFSAMNKENEEKPVVPDVAQIVRSGLIPDDTIR